MKFNPDLFKVPLKFGAFGGLLLSILLLILFFEGKHPLLIPIIIDFRLLAIPIFVFLATKEFRDYKNGRLLQYWQGMFLGFLCYFAMGIATGIFILLFSAINSEFLSEFIRISMQQLVENKAEFIKSIGAESYEANLAKLPFTTALDLSIDYLLKTIVLGLLFTIIISVFLKRQPKKE